MDKYDERARAFVEHTGMSPLTAEPPEKLASALAAELRAVAAEQREADARMCDAIAECIKHTEHADGPGMGNQSRERACAECAAAIRAAKEKR